MNFEDFILDCFFEAKDPEEQKSMMKVFKEWRVQYRASGSDSATYNALMKSHAVRGDHEFRARLGEMWKDYHKRADNTGNKTERIEVRPFSETVK